MLKELTARCARWIASLFPEKTKQDLRGRNKVLLVLVEEDGKRSIQVRLEPPAEVIDHDKVRKAREAIRAVAARKRDGR